MTTHSLLAENVKFIIVHCSDSSWGDVPVINDWHRQRGFDAPGGVPCGYHFVIRNGFRPSKVLWIAEHAFAGKYDQTEIRHWLRSFLNRFFSQQFKRSVMPDGPKVGSLALSPRGDWRMPSDASDASFK